MIDTHIPGAVPGAPDSPLDEFISRQLGGGLAGIKTSTFLDERVARCPLIARPGVGATFGRVVRRERHGGMVIEGVLSGPRLLATLARAGINTVISSAQVAAAPIQDTLSRIADIVQRINGGFRQDQILCSLFCATLREDAPHVEYVAAGRVHALLRMRGGSLLPLPASGPAIGEAVSVECRSAAFALPHAARLFCLTATPHASEASAARVAGKLTSFVSLTREMSLEREAKALAERVRATVDDVRIADLTLLLVDFERPAAGVDVEWLRRRLSAYEPAGQEVADPSVYLG
jgi:hypothetical protein